MPVKLTRLAPLVGTAVLAACAEPGVVRVIDGREVEGRFVNERAYALYAAGADAEARGQWDAALTSYGAAAEEDDSAEIWTRIGAVACRRSKVDAEAAFDRAQAHDAEYEPLWRERARCELTAGDPAEAHAASARAVELDPDRDETVVLHATITERLGRAPDAQRILEGLVTAHPGSVQAWRGLYEFARRRDDAPLRAAAARRLRDLAPTEAPALEKIEASLSPLAEVDAALARGDLATARRRAKAARLVPAELAARAAALGRSALAREQAELVLGADPSDATARIVLAVAADLAHDDATVARAMAGVPASAVAPSPLARLLFAEMLERRIGAEAALAWLGPSASDGSGDRGRPADPRLDAGGKAPVDPLVDAAWARARHREGR